MKYTEAGTYEISYKAVDECGNETVSKRNVIVLKEPYFVGVNDTSIGQGTHLDLTEGVKAYNSYDREIPFTVTPNEVDACSVGTQSFTYTAEGVTAERDITVTPVAEPVLSGVTPITVMANEEFDPLTNVTAVDGSGNPINVSVEEVITDTNSTIYANISMPLGSHTDGLTAGKKMRLTIVDGVLKQNDVNYNLPSLLVATATIGEEKDQYMVTSFDFDGEGTPLNTIRILIAYELYSSNLNGSIRDTINGTTLTGQFIIAKEV